MRLPAFRYCPSCRCELVLTPIEGQPRRSCPDCHTTWYENSKPCAGAILVDERGRVLMTRRAIEPYLGCWDLPGGYLEVGEHPEVGALREVSEETGLVAQLDGLVGIYVDRYGPEGADTLNLFYRGRITCDLALARAQDDVNELGFFDPAELPWTTMAFDNGRQALRDWLRQRSGWVSEPANALTSDAPDHGSDPFQPSSPRPLSALGDQLPPQAGPKEGWQVLGKHGPCFVCQLDNPAGLRQDLYLDGEVVRARFIFDRGQQGPPRHAHGGSSAALLDEVMGAVAWNCRKRMVAVRLEFDYRRPVPLEIEHEAIAWLERSGNRSIHVRSQLRLADGTIAVEGRGIFAPAPDHLMDTFGNPGVALGE